MPNPITYLSGAELEDLGLFITSEKELLDFSSGVSFSLLVGDGTSGSGGFTSTTNMTGATGQYDPGLPLTDNLQIPNVVKAWPTAGELNDLAVGLYPCVLTITRTVDNKQRKRKFYIRIERLD